MKVMELSSSSFAQSKRRRLLGGKGLIWSVVPRPRVLFQSSECRWLMSFSVFDAASRDKASNAMIIRVMNDGKGDEECMLYVPPTKEVV
jgi:hypothetical protein